MDCTERAEVPIFTLLVLSIYFRIEDCRFQVFYLIISHMFVAVVSLLASLFCILMTFLEQEARITEIVIYLSIRPDFAFTCVICMRYNN